MAESIVRQKSYDFAVAIIKFCKELRKNQHFDISRQLLRSGTSIGANVEEALAGRSTKDFLFKMAIASKEAREANYWLRLIRDSEIINTKRIGDLIEASLELVKMLTSIVKTANETMDGQKRQRTKPKKLKTKN